MMRKTIDKAKEVVEFIKRLDSDSEDEIFKASLNLEKSGLYFLKTFLENYDEFNKKQASKSFQIILSMKIDLDSKKEAKYIDQIIKNIVIRFNNEADSNMLSVWLSVLGRLGNMHTIPVIAKALLSNDKRVRANAVEALGKIGGEQVKELLVPYLKDSSNRVKANTAIALWEYGELREAVRQAFNEMVRDKDKWMKASAFYAFGEIKAEEFLQTLIGSLDDNDEDVCRNAFLALVSYAEQYSDLDGLETKAVKTPKKK